MACWTLAPRNGRVQLPETRRSMPCTARQQAAGCAGRHALDRLTLPEGRCSWSAPCPGRAARKARQPDRSPRSSPQILAGAVDRGSQTVLLEACPSAAADGRLDEVRALPAAACRQQPVQLAGCRWPGSLLCAGQGPAPRAAAQRAAAWMQCAGALCRQQRVARRRRRQTRSGTGLRRAGPYLAASPACSSPLHRSTLTSWSSPTWSGTRRCRAGRPRASGGWQRRRLRRRPSGCGSCWRRGVTRSPTPT